MIDADDPTTWMDELGRGFLPGLIGIEADDARDGSVRLRLAVRNELLAPNGYLHAATVIALADTACGYGCQLSLPDGVTGFTTIELKANFMGTARDGEIACEATRVHAGRTTQIWDAVVQTPNGREIALFRCTQLLMRTPEER